MGREGHKAKTKRVLKPVKQREQLGSMQNWKFESFGNKNPPTTGLGYSEELLYISQTILGCKFFTSKI